ncbi:TPA: hypothetical protein DEP58_05370 [Patescibacteria group bacterium]|nr:MAG: hypothetical protein UU98_C0003G0040 [Parcubacteria group bacterium GW2011_GWD2_42_14]HCC05697.1 hypothetical protein [Patescibacteria group bacterium]
MNKFKTIKVFIFLAVIGIMSTPFQINASSLDLTVTKYINSLKAQITTLKAENIELKAEIKSLRGDNIIKTKKVEQENDTAKDARVAYAKWNTIINEIELGKYNKGAVEGCKAVNGCPIKPFPTVLSALIKKLYNEGILTKAGYTEGYAPKTMSLESKVRKVIIDEIRLEQTKLQEKMM